MAKLFPPLIEGTVPAFYSEGDGAVKITVPFSLNRGVSKKDIKGLVLKIKTVQSSSYLGTIQQTNSLYFNLDNSPYVIFYLNKDISNKIRKGQFYKLQIAFIDKKNEIGYYSTVGISKYTALPTVFINNFNKSMINTHVYEYSGVYQQDIDMTEKVYSYCFNVYDNLNNLVASSGELLHNSQNDEESYTSYDSFTYASDLPLDTTYRIQYSVTTTNGLTVSSPKYKIAQKTTLEPNLNADINITTNYENGYINIDLVGYKNENNELIATTGAFLLSRTSQDSNFTEWIEISRFKFANTIANGLLWTDFTVEQGKTYQYSIQQYNDNNLYSNRMLTEKVYISFEDMFLSDGKKQLKIRYNPKVSSFKVDVLENKTDTIGSKHPYILRNGKAYYKEFPISGLISYFMDTDELFMIKFDDVYTTNLTDDNIYKERNFKMSVYDWLTNGEPKLFRSPGEGNYFVRLMNVSMTPMDATGRMLHTFNSTAYEIAEFNYKNLYKYGFVNPDEPKEAVIQWGSINLFEMDESGKGYLYAAGDQINTYPIYTLRITDALPGDRFNLVYTNGRTEEIEIGATGSYYIDLGVSIKGISMSEGNSHSGSLIYSYYKIIENKFDKISDIIVTEIPCQQFIGEHDIIEEITCVYDKNGNAIRNPKVDIVSILDLTVQRRTIINLEYDEVDKKYYYDAAHTRPFIEEEVAPFFIFAIGKYQPDTSATGRYDEGGNGVYITTGGTNENPFVAPNRAYYKFLPEYYYDFYNKKKYQNFSSTFSYNNEEISVEEIKGFVFKKPGACEKIKNNNGVVTDVTYQLRTTEFSIENEIHNGINLSEYKQTYIKAQQELDNLLNTDKNDYFNADGTVTDDYIQEVEKARENIKKAYTTFILKLVEAQQIDEQMGV